MSLPISRSAYLFALAIFGTASACGDDDGPTAPGGGNQSGGGASGGGQGGGAGSPSGGGSSGAAGSSAGSGGTIDQTLRELVINEVMSQNEGAWIDENGEADDWIEILNRSDAAVDLAGYSLADSAGTSVALPARTLEPGQNAILWVDSDPTQGAYHLPFKLTSTGDRLVLSDRDGVMVDDVEVPALDLNDVFARFPNGDGVPVVCRYSTPGDDNGASCAPAAPPPPPPDVQYEPFAFPAPFPGAPTGLAVSELDLRPDAGSDPFVELTNFGTAGIALDSVSLRLSTHAPSLPWPGVADGAAVPLPAGATLAPGQLLRVAVPPGALTALAADPAFEGVLTAFEVASDDAIDRVDFMRWPAGATLARNPDEPTVFRFCTNATPGQANTCDILASRDVGDRVRHLRTPGDFAALSEGASIVGIQSTKFVIDLRAPGLVHLIGSARWPLHYTFVRELVDLEPVLDRCDPDQNADFYVGWGEFSLQEYGSAEGRRFHLGTLSHHAGSNLDAVEFTFGDAVTGEQMREAFITLMPHTDDPSRWVLRPQDDEQVQKSRAIEGRAPLVGPNAPFANVTYQPLTEGVTYGTLKFVPAGELFTTSLGPTVIVITDDVPNDVPLVGGLITEAFQTPLAHVNVLSQNRGTPNAGLKNARTELAQYLDQLVKLTVSAAGIQAELADAQEAADFWASRVPAGDPVSPRLDASVRGVQDLADHDLASLPVVGAKAAQMAELVFLAANQVGCMATESFIVPEQPFAIPLVHYQEHFAASGAAQVLTALEADAQFASDLAFRNEGLAQVRQLILTHPVEPGLLAEVEAAIMTRWAQERVRFRSSSNTEDLPNFNGAGLYTSISAQLGDPERTAADAMRSVWASIWNTRAYDERAYARIQRDTLAMGILVHPASLSEEGNGVGVSRNVLEPTRGDQYYVNVQAGEASVTNPAPAVSTEQLVYQWGRQPPVLYHSQSSLLRAFPEPPATVLNVTEVAEVACALRAVHDHFRPLLDPDSLNPWFAMEIEFKFIGSTRRLHVKQARPHSFGQPDIIADCREI